MTNTSDQFKAGVSVESGDRVKQDSVKQKKHKGLMEKRKCKATVVKKINETVITDEGQTSITQNEENHEMEFNCVDKLGQCNKGLDQVQQMELETENMQEELRPCFSLDKRRRWGLGPYLESTTYAFFNELAQYVCLRKDLDKLDIDYKDLICVLMNYGYYEIAQFVHFKFQGDGSGVYVVTADVSPAKFSGLEEFTAKSVHENNISQPQFISPSGACSNTLEILAMADKCKEPVNTVDKEQFQLNKTLLRTSNSHERLLCTVYGAVTLTGKDAGKFVSFPNLGELSAYQPMGVKSSEISKVHVEVLRRQYCVGSRPDSDHRYLYEVCLSEVLDHCVLLKFTPDHWEQEKSLILFYRASDFWMWDLLQEQKSRVLENKRILFYRWGSNCFVLVNYSCDLVFAELDDLGSLGNTRQMLDQHQRYCVYRHLFAGQNPEGQMPLDQSRSGSSHEQLRNQKCPSNQQIRGLQLSGKDLLNRLNTSRRAKYFVNQPEKVKFAKNFGRVNLALENKSSDEAFFGLQNPYKQNLLALLFLGQKVLLGYLNGHASKDLRENHRFQSLSEQFGQQHSVFEDKTFGLVNGVVDVDEVITQLLHCHQKSQLYTYEDDRTADLVDLVQLEATVVYSVLEDQQQETDGGLSSLLSVFLRLLRSRLAQLQADQPPGDGEGIGDGPASDSIHYDILSMKRGDCGIDSKLDLIKRLKFGEGQTKKQPIIEYGACVKSQSLYNRVEEKCEKKKGDVNFCDDKDCVKTAIESFKKICNDY